MCLYYANKIETEEDIICYKVFEVIKGKLYSPIFKTKWELGETKKIDAEQPDLFGGDGQPDLFGVKGLTILEGNAYHSYRELDDPIAWCRLLCQHGQLSL